MLTDLNLKGIYSSDTDDLVREFYNPVLENAIQYDRITGFFSPKVLALASRGFARFFHNGGKIRVLTSIKVDQQTLESLERYEGQINELPDSLIPAFNLDELQTQLEKDSYDVFVSLLHQGAIELRIAATADDAGILHQKVGIITDRNGNALAFSGSNNETYYGWKINIEKFMVFPSWENMTHQYYSSSQEDFDALWNNERDAVRVMSVSQALKNNVLTLSRPDVSLDDKIAELLVEECINKAGGTTTGTQALSGISIRPYQQDAINSWVNNNYRGLFEMATGTGKTITGLFAVESLANQNGKLFCVIAVPLRHLVPQWMEDIEKIFPDARIVKVGSDYPTWRDDLPFHVRQYYKGRTNKIIVLTTYASMGTNDFTNIIKSYDNNCCLIADEVHNAGTERILDVIDLFKYRLGLSATPRNKWTDINEDKLVNTFGGIVYSYPLSEAIKNGVLVPYDYFPVAVYLNDEEAASYIDLSRKISAVMRQNEETRNSEMLTALLNQRSAIMKNAEEKNGLLRDLLSRLYEQGQYDKMLVYCDNQSQIADAQSILSDLHINSSKITFRESLPDRWRLLKDFSMGFVNTLVARKCLDEGVNMPSTKTAVLMASNTDSREYIQRLGRVLRTYPGKNKSIIYDFIVLPPHSNDIHKYKYLLRSELERVAFFQDNALNAESVADFKNDIELRYNISQDSN
jgi:superfamily II DNA or RNA helicase